MPDTDDPVSSIKNLGPASEAAFAKAGIHTAAELRALGADEGYRRLLSAGTQPHFIGYYVLVMALQGRPWNDCKGEEKKALRVRYDALKADYAGSHEKGRSDFEAALDLIGVVARRLSVSRQIEFTLAPERVCKCNRCLGGQSECA